MASNLYQILQKNNASVFKSVEFQSPSQSEDKAFEQLMTSVDWKRIPGQPGRWTVSLQSFPEAFRQAAMDLHLYETTDFHSVNQRLHEDAVKEGRAKGPYLCKSIMYRFWETAYCTKFQTEHHDAYQVVIQVENNQVLGISIWDRPKALQRFMVMPEPTNHAGRKPHYRMMVENLGKAMFLVNSKYRGQGIGRQLAQQLTQDIKAWQETTPHPNGKASIPALIVIDRAKDLMEHQNPPFECIPHIPFQKSYRNMVWKRYLDDFNRDERRYYQAVEVIPKQEQLPLADYRKMSFNP